MKKLLYLDNAAAAKPSEYALERFNYYAENCFVNQEAGHLAAFDLRQKLNEAAGKIICALTGGTCDGNLCWGGSGTEVLNCVCGLPLFDDPNSNILTTTAEHSALAAALGRCRAAKRVVRLRQDGTVDLDDLAAKCNERTVLTAIHHVQGESGVIQDFAAIHQIIKTRAPQALLLGDTVQSACKIALPWEYLDFAVLSGHKTGACGGAALLYKNRKFSEFFRAMRSRDYLIGRGEPAILLALADCVDRSCAKMTGNLAWARALNAHLRGLLGGIEQVRFTTSARTATPYIVHVTLLDYQGAVIVRALSQAGICVSAGAACESESKTPSKALTAMGFAKADAYSGLRISFGFDTTKEELDVFAAALRKVIAGY